MADHDPALAATQRARRKEEMIRVDHAGERGAVAIYAGQRAIFERGRSTHQIAAQTAEMEAGEKVHLQAFDSMIRDGKARPTALMPIWDAAGFALGAATALLGEKAAHACTEAVENVIEEHYAAQLAELGDSDPELSAQLTEFRNDELAHRDFARENGAAEAPAYPLLTGVIKLGCRTAIALSQKF
ncbi:MAG: demethoxyubiquinone hydroxylase family protein [Caulobacterales bacterium]